MNKTKDVLVPMSPEIYEIWKKGLNVTINNLQKELDDTRYDYCKLEDKLKQEQLFTHVLKNMLGHRFTEQPKIEIQIEKANYNVFGNNVNIKFNFLKYIREHMTNYHMTPYEYTSRYLVDYVQMELRHKTNEYSSAYKRLNKVKEEIIKEKEQLDIKREQLKIERNKKSYFSFKKLFK